jgi:hypothetical protein
VRAGTPPEPGMSRLTIETYRMTPDGNRVGRSRRRTVSAESDLDQLLPDAMSWPPCRCHRCHNRQGPAPAAPVARWSAVQPE